MKKFIRVLCVSAIAVATLSSCSREDNFKADMEAKTTHQQKNLVDAGPIIGPSRCIIPVITLSPCDKSFRFHATRSGVPDTSTYGYLIRTMSGTIVDAGTLTNATNTNPVLSQCTQYRISIFDHCAPTAEYIMFSDGCGNVWIC